MRMLYTFGVLVLVSVSSGVVATSVHAQDAVQADTETTVAPSQTTVRPAMPARVPDDVRAAMIKRAELDAIAARRANATSTGVQKRAEVKGRIEERRELKQERRGEIVSDSGTSTRVRAEVQERRGAMRDRIEFMRESTTTPARSPEQLRQLIEKRRMEIKDETASTTPGTRKILENAIPMRVAVHALLSSRDLLGSGIGQQVSEIAQHMNDSVASTTNAEAKIQSRGIFSRIFFGGDKKSAEAIAAQVEQNKTRLQTLAGLLASASTTEEVRATLSAQMQTVGEDQDRLQKVSEKQSKLWGIFSWRF